LRPAIKVIAAEPAGADDAAQSFREHRLVTQRQKNTIADGLRTDLGAPNFAVIQRYVDDVVTVTDGNIIAAMRAIWETMKVVVESSGAVPYAAILEGKVDCRSKRVGIILTGGNVDLDALPWLKF
jgi:threonine dehydratase